MLLSLAARFSIFKTYRGPAIPTTALAPAFSFTGIHVQGRSFLREKQERAHHGQLNLSQFPLRFHDSGSTMPVLAQKQMTNFMGDQATKHDRQIDICIVADSGEPYR